MPAFYCTFNIIFYNKKNLKKLISDNNGNHLEFKITFFIPKFKKPIINIRRKQKNKMAQLV